MSPQSPSNSSISTDTDQAGTAGKNPAAAFGANEWLVDEIYQQYLQDPNSVDRAWWDFFADYKPGAAATPTAAGTVPTDAGSTPPAAPAPRAQAPAQPQAAAPAPAPAKPAAAATRGSGRSGHQAR
ncbi:2-oxoglutarate dehydrogenase E1 subunit family protein, partial [Streptomyces lividans]|uniref:2-oxoglutarate dehydrogenase E1 subunit family protein n=1 Tax=Streptomyces lividans TaxID=1916 RepID=UPI0001B51AC4